MKVVERRPEKKPDPTPVGRAARHTSVTEAQGQLAWLRRAVLMLAELDQHPDNNVARAKLLSTVAVLEHQDKENWSWPDEDATE